MLFLVARHVGNMLCGIVALIWEVLGKAND